MNRHRELTDRLGRMQPTLSTDPAGCLRLRIGTVRVDLHIADAEVLARATEFFHYYRGTGPARVSAYLEVPREPALWEDEDPEFRISASRVIQRDFAAQVQPDGTVVG